MSLRTSYIYIYIYSYKIATYHWNCYPWRPHLWRCILSMAESKGAHSWLHTSWHKCSD